MDSFKTFNISTASAVIAATAGVCLARHGARAVTSHCGTVDVCEKMGIDVECQVSLVQKSLEQANIGLFNGMSSQVHPRALFRLLKAMRFGSILNIAASLANPAAPRLGVRGVYSKEIIPTVAQTMKEMGFCQALVFHGQSPDRSGGMDEISPFGTTWIAELQEDGDIRNYTIDAQDFGTFSIRPETITSSSDPEQEALRLVHLLRGTEHGTPFFTVCLNTAPILYLAGQVDTLHQGFEMASEILRSGQALLTLKNWICWQNKNPESGLRTFNRLVSRVGPAQLVYISE
jgi:anthranilate phosphoribosyltransferase